MRLKLVVALIAGALVFGACSTGPNGSGTSEDAKARLTAALLQTSGGDSGTATISLDTDTSSLTAISNGELTEEQAQAIADGTLTVSSKGKDPATATSLTTLDLGDQTVLEMRQVDNTLYLRADVDSIARLFGQDQAALDDARRQAKGLGLDWIDTVFNGDWIAIKNLSQAQDQLGQTNVDQQKMLEGIANDVTDNATVTDEGEEDGASHLVATLPIRQTLEDVLGDLGPASQTLQGLGTGLQDVPDGEISVDFWVAGNTIERIRFDLLQLGKLAPTPPPDGVDKLAIDVALSDFDGNVEPVEDAVEVDLEGLMQSLLGGLGGLGGDTGGGIDCSMLQGAPPQVIKLYKKECPELQK
ncbi:MAG TPA: hypothetical protein VFK89_11605 [Actinomycetota bacterium]|nr:hypothetical protein [Actinomycetota bacterium]